jgi:CheY-like chemotaxis protein
MPESLDDFMMNRPPTAERPLLGQTILVIEDSRYASEALRLMSLRSGARVRRADCLRTAARHLSTYRPSVVIIDVGLPDGSGAQLISDLANAKSRIPVILGTSGDDGLRDIAIGAGADGFLTKPISSLSLFQQTILDLLPPETQPKGLRLVTDDTIEPDRIALHDDLTYAANLLSNPSDAETIDYLAQFLAGIARSAKDQDMEAAANDLAASDGEVEQGAQIKRMALLVDERLKTREVV